MRSIEIRAAFCDHLRSRGHYRLPARPLIPPAQSEGCFPPAGGYALQPSLRPADIAKVGRTRHHATVFELLAAGMPSTADEEAATADEEAAAADEEAAAAVLGLLAGRLGLDPGRLTVDAADPAAAAAWARAGVPRARAARRPAPGRSGRTVLRYDLPTRAGPRSIAVCALTARPGARIGLGLERLAMISQNVPDLCQIDLLAPTLRLVEDLAGHPSRTPVPPAVSSRVVAEHVRAATFLVADGLTPADHGAGQVLRRLIRRAVHHAGLLGIGDPVLAALTGRVVDTHSPAWPHLRVHQPRILAVTAAEEAAFRPALRRGCRILDTAISAARVFRQTTLPARTVRELHDAHGFPIDVTAEMARAGGLAVDETALRATTTLGRDPSGR